VQTYGAGDWFAIPLRFGLFTFGRAASVDPRGAILGYFFAQFFERLPSGADIIGVAPGDAEIIGVCDGHGLRSGEWPLIPAALGCDPGPWSVPVFRTIEPETGTLRWSTVDQADLRREIVFAAEPRAAGVRNWGLSMLALDPMPMSSAEVELALWRRFRTFQNAMHRKYIAQMQRAIAPRVS
jgi:hypothetical protein